MKEETLERKIAIMLTRDQILKIDDIKTEEVNIPEWGDSVKVRGLTGTERDAWEESILEQKGKNTKVKLKNARAKLVSLSVVDEEGNRIFSDGDVEALGKKSAAALDRIYEVAWKPYADNQLTFVEAVDRGSQPLKAFMLKQTREEDLALFVTLANHPPLNGPEETPMKILVPAYVISELKTAFQIGFIVFIPFLIIDLVVASVLMSMGMIMLPPVMISMPFEIILFVLVDGWSLITQQLVLSFR